MSPILSSIDANAVKSPWTTMSRRPWRIFTFSGGSERRADTSGDIGFKRSFEAISAGPCLEEPTVAWSKSPCQRAQGPVGFACAHVLQRRRIMGGAPHFD